MRLFNCMICGREFLAAAAGRQYRRTCSPAHRLARKNEAAMMSKRKMRATSPEWREKKRVSERENRRKKAAIVIAVRQLGLIGEFT